METKHSLYVPLSAFLARLGVAPVSTYLFKHYFNSL